MLRRNFSYCWLIKKLFISVFSSINHKDTSNNFNIESHTHYTGNSMAYSQGQNYVKKSWKLYDFISGKILVPYSQNFVNCIVSLLCANFHSCRINRKRVISLFCNYNVSIFPMSSLFTMLHIMILTSCESLNLSAPVIVFSPIVHSSELYWQN